jgi:DNA primase
VRRLAQLAGVPFPEREWDPEKLRQAEEREHRANLLECFLSYARTELFRTGTEQAREHLLRRGFSEANLQELGFGVYTSPADVKAKLLDGGFSKEEIYASGILGTDDPNKNGWDVLSGRIVGAFGRSYGRLLSVWAGYVGTKPPKAGPPPYITLGPRFMPFGLDEARRLDKKDLLLVEGPIKALLSYSLGLDDPFPIASGGDLTDAQIKTLEGYLRHSGSLTINWDYDSEAKDGIHGRTLKTLDRLSHVSFKVYVVSPSLMAQGVSNED